MTSPSPSSLTVLVIGTGGREHALVHALAQDPAVAAVHAAPGNPGMAAEATLHAVVPMSGDEVAGLAASLAADLVVIGPEAPLVAGVADAVRRRGIACFGPTGEAARLEGSKAFAKEVMEAAGVPTARAFVCTTAEQVAAALDELGAPYVVKDDGLAAGKGVVVTEDRQEAVDHAAGCEQVVVEEYLDGPEVSLFAITTRSQAAAWASASSRSPVTTTPLPAASPSSFTTYGGPKASRASAASSAFVHTRAIAVGTSAAAITSLANALEPSSRAASADGPKQEMPASRTASATPATRGASGPITTRSAPTSRASAATARPSTGSTSWRVQTPAMPGLPGAACTAVTLGSRDSARVRACSRPPVPMTRTCTAQPSRRVIDCSRPGPTPTPQNGAPETSSSART